MCSLKHQPTVNYDSIMQLRRCCQQLFLLSAILLITINCNDRGQVFAAQPFKVLKCEIKTDPIVKTRIELTCNNMTIKEELGFLNEIGSRKKDRYQIVKLNISHSTPQNINSLFQSIDLPSVVVSDQLTHLTLSNCKLDKLPLDMSLSTLLARFPMLQQIDFSNNLLTTLGDKVDIASTNLTSARLDGNKWNCDDPNNQWLFDSFADYSKTFEKVNETRCASPSNYAGMTFAQKRAVDSSEICNVLNCSCYVVNTYLAINCSGKGLTEIPQLDLPASTRIVILNDNEISKLSFPVDKAEWDSINRLYLQNNTIDSLDGLTERKVLNNLRTLHLQSNRLTGISPHILEQLKGLEQFQLGDNPWFCDCHITVLQDWLEERLKKGYGVDIDDIRCANDRIENNVRNGLSASPTAIVAELKGQVVYKTAKSDLCGNESDPIAYLDVISATLGALTILIILKLVYDWHWQKRTGKLPRFFKINI